MDETGKKLLNLMFKEGETICVSPDKFGYHSLPLSSILNDETVNLILPNAESEGDYKQVPTSDLLLVALNPIDGFRKDSNCKAFRNFLIEMDSGSLKDQIVYIRDQLKMPYSAAVFSGGKSVHFLISLEDDLPNEDRYRYIAQYILNIATWSDQNCKNPSRSIRIPGAYREPDKKQRLLELKGKVAPKELGAWLKQFAHLAPKPKEKRSAVFEGEIDVSRVPKWVFRVLADQDFSHGRNKTWFSIACTLAERGLSEDLCLNFLSRYFQEDRDFKEREWLLTIKSAYKTVFEK